MILIAKGPIIEPSNTQGDFWQMIWEQNVLVIVMTTPLEEHFINRMVTKCDQYWPANVGETKHYGDQYQVTTREELVHEHYTETILELKAEVTSGNGNYNLTQENAHTF